MKKENNLDVELKVLLANRSTISVSVKKDSTTASVYKVHRSDDMTQQC